MNRTSDVLYTMTYSSLRRYYPYQVEGFGFTVSALAPAAAPLPYIVLYHSTDYFVCQGKNQIFRPGHK
jgi:hypothetical protein